MIQTISHRPSYRSPVGARLLFRDLVRHHYLPSLRDASRDTRKNAASHLGNGSGVRAQPKRLRAGATAMPVMAPAPSG